MMLDAMDPATEATAFSFTYMAAKLSIHGEREEKESGYKTALHDS